MSPSRTNQDRLSFIEESGHAFSNGCQTPDVEDEQRKILAADAVILPFPLWCFSMPAIMKGWVDRVGAFGLAYGYRVAGKESLSVSFDPKTFIVHNIREFPFVVFSQAAVLPDSSQWETEMVTLVGSDQPFVVVHDQLHSEETHEDRKHRGVWPRGWAACGRDLSSQCVLASERDVMLDDGVGFWPVLRKPLIEQRLGQQRAATVRGAGVSWEMWRQGGHSIA